MYNAHFFAQMFEGKEEQCVIRGYNDCIPGHTMGIIVPCIVHTEMWVRIIHRGASSKYGTLNVWPWGLIYREGRRWATQG